MKLDCNKNSKVGYQVSPLVDIVFLLLIYFMVTASLVKKESDIAFALPDGTGVGNLPVEVIVQIGDSGAVEVDGIRFSQDDRILDGLIRQLRGLKNMADSQQSDFHVTLLPHQEALHQRVLDVMNACTAAGVRQLGFSRSI